MEVYESFADMQKCLVRLFIVVIERDNDEPNTRKKK